MFTRLKQVAAITQDSRYVDLQRLSEKLRNKVSLLSFENCTKLVAKLPNPNVGHPYDMVASEAATLDFVSLFVIHYLLIADC